MDKVFGCGLPSCEAEEKAEILVQNQQQVRKQHERRRKRLSLERQMTELAAQSEMEEEEERQIGAQENALAKTFASNRNALAHLRGTDQFIPLIPGGVGNDNRGRPVK